MSEIKEISVLVYRGKHRSNKGSENICNMLEKTLKEKNLNVKVSIDYGSCQHLHIFGSQS